MNIQALRETLLRCHSAVVLCSPQKIREDLLPRIDATLAELKGLETYPPEVAKTGITRIDANHGTEDHLEAERKP